MKRKKYSLLRLIPVFVLAIITTIISFYIYAKMIENEEESCWERLENATNSTAEKIQVRLDDNINFIKSSANAYILTHNFDDVEEVGKYLNSAMERTIFDRLDIILPNNMIVTQDGIVSDRGGKSSFEDLAAKGTHVTQRITSSFHGEEVICIVTPILNYGEVKGLLVGTINCKTLNEIFRVFTYETDSMVFIVDRADGNYIMDNWHEKLGNIYDIGLRQSIDGEEMLDMVPAIINGEKERFSFISNTNAKNTYQYSAPIDGYNWTLCVAVQEDVVFESVNTLSRMLQNVAIVEFIIILLYIAWNIILNYVAVRNETKLQLLEYDRAKTEARSKFISNMSHDIRTPLNGIIGMVEISKTENNDINFLRDCMKKIEISAKHLSNLAGDILDISEIENDKLELLSEPLDLRKVISDITSIMDRTAKDVKVSFSVDSSKLNNPFIIGSVVHIERVLINLLDNAIKYSADKGNQVLFEISDEPYDSKKRMYQFVIKDNGIGMSKEFQKNIYSAFEQETEDARSEYRGYGLGLTIVNYLVNKMLGTIELESEKDVGTVFTVKIPFLLDDTNNITESKQTENVSLSGYRILLVEDNEFNMEVAETLLSNVGAIVDKAVNGKLATEIFEQSEENTYDAIIMDIMMPQMDGCEATRVIRQMDRADAKTVSIVAMTANTFQEDVKRCMDAGMNDFIPKPLDVQQFITTIFKCNN